MEPENRCPYLTAGLPRRRGRFSDSALDLGGLVEFALGFELRTFLIVLYRLLRNKNEEVLLYHRPHMFRRLVPLHHSRRCVGTPGKRHCVEQRGVTKGSWGQGSGGLRRAPHVFYQVEVHRIWDLGQSTEETWQ